MRFAQNANTMPYSITVPKTVIHGRLHPTPVKFAVKYN